MREVTLFLDYEIINSGNTDGWVLRSPKELTDSNLWETHLGNYSSLRKAQESAVTYFMIKRPNTFHAQIHHRTLGTKTSHEWFTFKRVLKAEGIPMPPELTHDAGFTIVFTDEPYYDERLQLDEDGDVVALNGVLSNSSDGHLDPPLAGSDKEVVVKGVLDYEFFEKEAQKHQMKRMEKSGRKIFEYSCYCGECTQPEKGMLSTVCSECHTAFTYPVYFKEKK